MDISAIFAKNADTDNGLWQYLLFFGVIIGGIQMGIFLHSVCESYLKKPFYSPKFRFRNFIIYIIKEPLVLAGVTTGIWLSTFVLRINEGAMDFFSNLVLLQVAVTLTWTVLRTLERICTSPDMQVRLISDEFSPLVIWKVQTAIVDITTTVIVLWILGFGIAHILAGFGLSGLSITLARSIGYPIVRTGRSSTRKRSAFKKHEHFIHDDELR